MAIYNAVPPPPSLMSPTTTSHQHEAEGVEHAQGHSQIHHHDGHVPGHQHAPSVASSVDIEAWTVSALEALSVSPVARGTGTPLSIPLDATAAGAGGRGMATSAPTPTPAARPNVVDLEGGIGGIAPPRRPPSRRDSQRRRELLLKGNEGSRQRRRWENDRLMHVPGAVPPQPADMVPAPTHPVHEHVPYHVAQLWDRGLRQHVEEERARAAAARRRRQQLADAGLLLVTPSSTAAASAAAGGIGGSGSAAAAAPLKAKAKSKAADEATAPLSVGRVPRELRDTAKRTPALKSWVRVLEEPVRRFLIEEDARLKQAAAAAAASEQKQQKQKQQQRQAGKTTSPLSGGESGLDSEDEEIVFVGRRRESTAAAAAAREVGLWKKAHRETRDKGTVDSGVVFDSLGDDESSAFKRWLTHSISDYYGLSSRSATVGAPPRRVVYVTIKPAAGSGSGARSRAPQMPTGLPRPLWELF